MSHEGIRIVREDEARQIEEQNQALPPEATEPVRVRVHKTEGTGMEIEWKDGHHSHWSFTWLRHACPCATCHEEREHDHRQPGEARKKVAELFPLYEPPPSPVLVSPVGHYAISFHWNDGHTSGIYSWDYLRRHCACALCTGRK